MKIVEVNLNAQGKKFGILVSRFNDFITARVEVIENVVEKGKIRLKTVGFNQHGAQVMDGEALLSYPKG